MKALNFSLIKSFRFRLIIMLFSLILIPFLVFGFIIYNTIKENTIENTRVSATSNLKKTANYMDDILMNTEAIYLSMLADEDFLKIFKDYKSQSDITSVSDYQNHILMWNYIFNTASKSKYIDSIYISNTSNKSFSSSLPQKAEAPFDTVKSSKWYADATSALSGNYQWFATEPLANGHNAEPGMISYCNRVSTFTDRTELGMISLNLSKKKINDILINMNDIGRYPLLIIDDYGKIITQIGDTELIDSLKATNSIDHIISESHESSFTQTSNDKAFIIYTTSAYTKWHYAVIIPYNQIIMPAIVTRNYIILLYIFIIIFALISLGIGNLLFYKPINKLFVEMKKFEMGDLTSNILHYRKDEFGYIYDRYNTMVKGINTLVNDVYVHKLMKQEAEIRVLQIQINEHFLYNTLDSIFWLSTQDGFKEARKMVYALSRFYRLFLSNGNDIVQIREVVTMLTHYIDIMKIRHKNKFEIELSVDENVPGFYALKYIFQPIVENAILHGAEQRKHGGVVTIKFELVGNNIVFQVIDNGPGIPEAKLNKLKDSLSQDNNEDENFALSCINHQIKLFYGAEYGVDIKSVENQGTVVTIAVSAKIKIKEDHNKGEEECIQR